MDYTYGDYTVEINGVNVLVTTFSDGSVEIAFDGTEARGILTGILTTLKQEVSPDYTAYHLAVGIEKVLNDNVNLAHASWTDLDPYYLATVDAYINDDKRIDAVRFVRTVERALSLRDAMDIVDSRRKYLSDSGTQS